MIRTLPVIAGRIDLVRYATTRVRSRRLAEGKESWPPPPIEGVVAALYAREAQTSDVLPPLLLNGDAYSQLATAIGSKGRSAEAERDAALDMLCEVTGVSLLAARSMVRVYLAAAR